MPEIVAGCMITRGSLWLGAAIALLGAAAGLAGNGALEMRHGYFWNPLQGDYFIPRGMAYQTWNPPVGANQTFEQLTYDFTEFKKMHCNSVRCEMVWSEVETNQNQFDFSKTDYLVAEAERLGFKLFVLIGFQYAPPWFPSEWRAINDQTNRSDVLVYDHPEARRTYSNYIARVTGRYKDRPAIGAWILGNEYAYFDIWTIDKRFLGFDPVSIASFQSYCSNLYGGDIEALNANWFTNSDRFYTDFAQVEMSRTYPSNRYDPSYIDLIHWREKSVGEFVAVGAVAAKTADPNHLRTYSMIGGLYNGNDAFYTCEDAKTIVDSCQAAGAPLHFWAINNYAVASTFIELRSADFGIGRHQAASGLPVLISETGHSSTDNLFPDSSRRQAAAIPGQMWEALVAGAIGTHIFTWNDRERYADYDVRERGFGVALQSRLPKDKAYENIVELFRRMENLPVERLFPGSVNPPPDVQLLWPEASKMGWPRANQENAMFWGILKRLGYQPGILYDDQFARGEYTRAPVLALSRCFQLEPDQLHRLTTEVVARGIHIHANADLPGQYDMYQRTNPAWPGAMKSLFGLEVTNESGNAVAAWDKGIGFIPNDTNYVPCYLRVTQNLDPLVAGTPHKIKTWKIWHNLSASPEITIATHTGIDDQFPTVPALVATVSDWSFTAANTFGLADLQIQWDQPPLHDYDFRYDWTRAIYRGHFVVPPIIDLTGTGAQYVIPDYRKLSNGSVLISLLNGVTNSATVTLSSSVLLKNKVVEDLLEGGILETNCSGTLSNLAFRGDQYRLLYVYRRSAGVDASLLNPNPSKLWLQSVPEAVWPRDPTYPVTVGFDTTGVSGTDSSTLTVTFERVSWPPKTLATTDPVSIGGRGARTLHVSIPDPDLNDVHCRSSLEGAEFVFRARLSQNGQTVAETDLPTRLLWGVRPRSLPTEVRPGQRVDVTVDWQELPGYEAGYQWNEYGRPLDRAKNWSHYAAAFQNYHVLLEMVDAQGQTVAAEDHITRTGTGNHTFRLTAPEALATPVSWQAYLRPHSGVSGNLHEGFENRGPGRENPYDFTNQAPLVVLDPWMKFGFAENWDAAAGMYQNSGVTGESNEYYAGELAAFLVYTNPPDCGAYSGFGMVLTYPFNWSLPADTRLWSNHTFSVAFREKNQQPCRIELQLNDDIGESQPENGQLRFLTDYVPGTDGWFHLSVPLSRFEVTPHVGHFSLDRVRSIAVVVHTPLKGVQYVGLFDEIQFQGPEWAPMPMASRDLVDSFENRRTGSQWVPGLTDPWTSYVYPTSGSSTVWYDQGVGTVACHGLQAAFLVAGNALNPAGDSGFGFTYVFPEAWALPADPKQWTNYAFGFDFLEENRRPCDIQLRVQSSADSWIEFGKRYVPSSPGGWDTVEATLDRFATVGTFDPNHVEALSLNIRALHRGATYVGFFDNVRFLTPKTFLPPDFSIAQYRSATATALPDRDWDGLPDVSETGTGVWVSETDTGTSPDNPDTDGDSVPDGWEVELRTDPNDAADRLELRVTASDAYAEVTLSWHARAGVVYTVMAADALPGGETLSWWMPVTGLTELSVPVDQDLEAGVGQSLTGQPRYYRLEAKR